MPFCGSCGGAINERAKFCTACRSGTAPSTTNRLKPFGIVMFAVAGLYFLMAIMRYNSAAYQFLGAFGGIDPTLVRVTIYGLLNGIVAFFLFTSEPRVFLKLSRGGLITFAILMAIIPVLCWIPWLIPALKEKPGPILSR
jgi:predicted nucleic acid-binding Zn ribbon protein